MQIDVVTVFQNVSSVLLTARKVASVNVLSQYNQR